MFRTVALGVLNFLIAYVSLVIGFAVAFMILFPNPDNDVFQIFPSAIIQLCVMMLGEIDYGELVKIQLFPVTAHLTVILFLFLVSIVLMNLLVGLAVNDIQGLSKSAKLNQLQQQVDLINYMENLLFSPIFTILPDRLKKFLRDKLQGLEGQTNRKVYTVKPFDSNDKFFSENIKKSLYENCLKRVNKEKEFNKNAALLEMQNKINEMYQAIITGGHMKRSYNQSKQSIISNISVYSSQLQVDDDIDDEDIEDLPQYSGLGSIVEESRSPWSFKPVDIDRRNSNLSSGTVESEAATVSDYIGSSEDKFDSINEMN